MKHFGPLKPHWLAQVTSGFKRHPDKDVANPAIPIYSNAVYFFNQRASTTQPPSSLRLDIISHVFYAFASDDTLTISRLGPDGVVYLADVEKDMQMQIDGALGCMRAFQSLKRTYPHLKPILSIGGATGGANFAAVAADPAKRTTCANTARTVIDLYGFDGIDIDWEYPEPGQQSSDYIQLLATLRERLPGPRYVLTTALPAGQWVLARIDLRQAATYLDLLNLMAYDYCGDWDPKISGHQAQLHCPAGGPYTQCAVDYALSQGFPANKILLGCPTYGWAFLGCDNINQPFSACGGQGGAFDYRDLPRPAAQEFVDENAVAAFCVGGDGGFVTYDNPRTVQLKAKYVKEKRLGGMFFWHASSDAEGPRSLVYASYTELHC
ncbi:glycoside hydrolase [Tothia fuscella]|uniref:chitinase n=1 Tax=Tothia fuscella TaxID=1048955 RepID=A0A9P4P033_9PEZI|nr:glycoside hydrolase [Tothia fuscella]